MARLTKAAMAEAVDTAFVDGFEAGKIQAKVDAGRLQGYEAAKREDQSNFSSAKTAMCNAAAEMAQANAKLTYAMSRILSKDGW